VNRRLGTRPGTRIIVFLVILLAATVLPSGAAQAKEVGRNCAGGWLGWAQYKDDGRTVKMTLRPTKRAYLVMGAFAVGPMWDAYFDCIGWYAGFDRLTENQWSSLWLQHRCHVHLGGLGRRWAGDTFDYESSVPNRGSLSNAIAHRCQ
jgi:hypothetical protein